MRKTKQRKPPMSRSENMAKIKPTDTTSEIILRRELWKRGLRYRKNDSSVLGKPDIVFKSKKIAIFCDSEFWHGRKMLEGEIPKTHQEFWEKKLKRNIARDQYVNQALSENGWRIFRFWEKDIKKDVVRCADMIEQAIKGDNRQ